MMIPSVSASPTLATILGFGMNNARILIVFWSDHPRNYRCREVPRHGPREAARHGLRGVRIGEASHPGPGAAQRCRACLAAGVDGIAVPGEEWCYIHAPPAPAQVARPGPVSVADAREPPPPPPQRRRTGIAEGAFAIDSETQPASDSALAAAHANGAVAPQLEVDMAVAPVPVTTASGASARLRAERDRRAGMVRWTLSNAPRAFGPRRPNPQLALVAWLDAHSDFLAEGEAARVRRWLGSSILDTETAPLSAVSTLVVGHAVDAQPALEGQHIVAEQEYEPNTMRCVRPRVDVEGVRTLLPDDEQATQPASPAALTAALTIAAEPVGEARAEPRSATMTAEADIAVELKCSLCSRYRTRGAGRNLILHLVRAHPGEQFGEALCHQLTSIGRGVCNNPGCGHIRVDGSTSCAHCGRRSAVRRPMAIDKIPGNEAETAPDVLEPAANPRQCDPLPPDAGEQFRGEPCVPFDFLPRVCALPSHTRRGIPSGLRPRFAKVDADSLERALSGSDAWGMLAEAWPKLLLGPLLAGQMPYATIRKRLDLWDTRRWEELLCAAEKACSRGHGSHQLPDLDQIRRRTRRSVRCGAFRKAVQNLSSQSFQC